MNAGWRPARRDYVLLAGVALIVALAIGLGTTGPGYTDAYYYFNAGQRLATGQGLTDPYVALTYIGAPESLPAPSHTYWMPLASLLAALGGGSFRAAQIPFGCCGSGWCCWLSGWGRGWAGRAATPGRRACWRGLRVLRALFVTTDTFTPFGLFGALCLLCTGMAAKAAIGAAFAGAGALAGLAHLTRADGLLLAGW